MLQEFREFNKQMIHEKHQKVIAGLQRGELSANMRRPTLIHSGFRSQEYDVKWKSQRYLSYPRK